MKARLPRGMGGGARNMNRLIKQAQKMQDDMKELQERLEITEYEGTSAAGLVKATVNGKYEVLSIDADEELTDDDTDIEMLMDLAAAAVNDAIKNARADSEAEMEKITGGMNMPGVL